MHSRSKELVNQAYFWSWTFLSNAHEHINGHFYCILRTLTLHIKYSLEEKNKLCAKTFCSLLKANNESKYKLSLTAMQQHSLIICMLIKTSKSYFTYKINIKIKISVTWILHTLRYNNKAKRSFKAQCFESVVFIPAHFPISHQKLWGWAQQSVF